MLTNLIQKLAYYAGKALLKGVVVITITGLVRSHFVENKVAVGMILFRCN
ncbi:MAG: hypothetical protein WBL67_19575 [Nitrososphaeraceae archaeon]